MDLSNSYLAQNIIYKWDLSEYTNWDSNLGVTNESNRKAQRNTDTTSFDFLEKLRLSFMAGIPNSLANGTSKRNLIKNIKDLYASKGTSEATKLFMRIFLGVSVEESQMRGQIMIFLVTNLLFM